MQEDPASRHGISLGEGPLERRPEGRALPFHSSSLFLVKQALLVAVRK
mgnify:CR=1 FL=1